MMMSKRHSGLAKEENYEHVLMCLICRSLFDDHDHQPKFLPCHHTFCKDCLREYIRQMGDEIECPSCRKIATIPAAGVAALQTNFYVRYIQSLVYGGGPTGCVQECHTHKTYKLSYFCTDCKIPICDKCCAGGGEDGAGSKGEGSGTKCVGHTRVPLTTITEEYHLKLDSAFDQANVLIEQKKIELEALLKCLSEEKDEALLKIEATFEQHVHTLNRRATLLKNKVIDIYNEHTQKLESDIEEISTALTCVLSLKEYHENLISKGLFIDTDKGIGEIDEVFENVRERIKPKENHIVFEDRHGVDKFKATARDVGRVRSSRPTLPRTEPEGKDAIKAGIVGVIHVSPDTPNSESGTPPLSASFAVGGNAMSFPPEEMGAVGGCEGGAFAAESPTTGGAAALGASPESYPSGSPSRRNRDRNYHRCDAGASIRKGDSASRDQPNAHGHSAPTANHKLDINSNAPVNVPGVVRPKTLPAANSRQIKGKMSSKDNGLLAYSCNAKHGQGAAKTSEVVGPPSRRGNNTQGGVAVALGRSGGSVPTGVASSASASAAGHLVAPLSGHDMESLKQADKMYHHLVYTSYDEEELLRELKSGKAHFDPAKQGRTIEDSDSWMTVSSDSTLSGGSEDQDPLAPVLTPEQSTL